MTCNPALLTPINADTSAIVVGGGRSGQAAARLLRRLGATVRLLEILIEKDTSKQIVKMASRPAHRLSRREMKYRLILDTLPTFSGVFQILDKDKNIVYVGRSNNIYKQMTHLLSLDTQVGRAIQEAINTVTWEEVPSQLISYLKYIGQVRSPVLTVEPLLRWKVPPDVHNQTYCSSISSVFYQT